MKKSDQKAHVENDGKTALGRTAHPKPAAAATSSSEADRIHEKPSGEGQLSVTRKSSPELTGHCPAILLKGELGVLRVLVVLLMSAWLLRRAGSSPGSVRHERHRRSRESDSDICADGGRSLRPGWRCAGGDASAPASASRPALHPVHHFALAQSAHGQRKQHLAQVVPLIFFQQPDLRRARRSRGTRI